MAKQQRSNGVEKFSFDYKPRNPRQVQAADAIAKSRLMFLIGEAGVGKTGCALGMALTELAAGRVEKIVVIRPTVTVGERLGYLPGDLDEKITPFFGPIEDCFEDLSDDKMATIWATLKGKIKAVPVGMVRGRTFKKSFVILDESQNCEFHQLKAIVTRIGRGSRMVVCGDTEQSDIPTYPNPLSVFASRASRAAGVSVIKFLKEDQLRDPFVSDLLSALS